MKTGVLLQLVQCSKFLPTGVRSDTITKTPEYCCPCIVFYWHAI